MLKNGGYKHPDGGDTQVSYLEDKLWRAKAHYNAYQTGKAEAAFSYQAREKFHSTPAGKKVSCEKPKKEDFASHKVLGVFLNMHSTHELCGFCGASLGAECKEGGVFKEFEGIVKEKFNGSFFRILVSCGKMTEHNRSAAENDRSQRKVNFETVPESHKETNPINTSSELTNIYQFEVNETKNGASQAKAPQGGQSKSNGKSKANGKAAHVKETEKVGSKKPSKIPPSRIPRPRKPFR